MSHNSNKYHDIKHIVIMCLWAVLAIAVVALIVRRCACKRVTANAAESTVIATTAVQPVTTAKWQKVVLPEGVSDVTLAYKAFTVHFNPREHIPNCVVYELTGEHTNGNVRRYKRFEADPNVADCAFPEYYSRSGFDRGHLAPAGDFKWDSLAMRQTFLMTNVCPQNHSFNEGMWHKLEKKVREWAVRDSAIVIAAGVVPDTSYFHTERGQVAIPKQFFKVVAAPFARPPRAIAFMFPNEPCRGSLQQYAISVDSLEIITGFDFHAGLPVETQAEIESNNDYSIWLTK